MSTTCILCGHTRTKEEDIHLPDWKCPKCQTRYDKAQALLEKKKYQAAIRKSKEDHAKEVKKEKAKQVLLKAMKYSSICSSCGELDSSKTVTHGSIFIEILLWLCFIIPGLIYSLWRHTTKHKACSSCGGNELLKLTSPKGKLIFEELHLDGNKI
jgi:DNA-directed RNA polymerase subunit M/transcription elongation factor TFIIS